MRTGFANSLALLTLGACHTAPLPPVAPARVPTTAGAVSSEALVDEVRAIFASIAVGDTTALRPRLSDSLRWVLATRGTVVSKPQLLTAAGRTTPVVTLHYQVDSVRVWQDGGVATAEYQLTDQRTFGKHTNTFVSRGVDVFAREAGRWRLRHHAQSWLVHAPATGPLDTAAIQAFIGRYERGPGFIDEVHLVDGMLRATSSAEQQLGLPGANLLPVSEDTFSPEGSAPMIVFERDRQGRVVGYVQQQPDGTIVRARRLPDR